MLTRSQLMIAIVIVGTVSITTATGVVLADHLWVAVAIGVLCGGVPLAVRLAHARGLSTGFDRGVQQGRLDMLADVTEASGQDIPLEDLVESEITRVRAWGQLRGMPIGVHRHAPDDPCNDACVET